MLALPSIFATNFETLEGGGSRERGAGSGEWGVGSGSDRGRVFLNCCGSILISEQQH